MRSVVYRHPVKQTTHHRTIGLAGRQDKPIGYGECVWRDIGLGNALNTHFGAYAVICAFKMIAHLLPAIAWEGVAVKPREVSLVEYVLDVVEPAGADLTHQNLLYALIHAQDVIERKYRRRFGAHIGEDCAADFFGPVGRE